jgi:PAS domain S-box-containing protein
MWNPDAAETMRPRFKASLPLSALRETEMEGEEKTKEQLLGQVAFMRGRIAELEEMESASKRADEALRESEDRYRAFMDATSDMVYVKDDQFRHVLANKTIVNFFGREEAEVLGKTDFELMPEHAAGNCRSSDLEAIRTKSIVVTEERVGDRVYEATKFPVGLKGNKTGVGGIIRDVTERKRAEEELKAIRAQLSNALEMAHLGHWEFDVANDGFTFNDQFYKIFHTSVEQIGGYTMHSAEYAQRFVHSDDIDLVGEEIKKAIETTDPNFNRTMEHRMLYADGTVGYISVRFFIVKDSHGRTVRTYGVNQDITESKRAEKALRESEEQLRSLSSRLLEAQEEERRRLASELHDTIGQTLAACKFWVEMVLKLRDEGNAGAALNHLEKFVPILQRSIEETRCIYMGLRPSMLDSIGLLATLEWQRREFMELYPNRHIELEISIAEEEIPESLKVNIFRIVQEALNNVAKHSKAEWVDVSLSKNSGGIELVVSDDGVGMDLELILHTSATRSLGITGMRERAELTGGGFSIEAAPGEGTTVRASWPFKVAGRL